LTIFPKNQNSQRLGIGCLHFKQFAGGESADELTLNMKKISNTNVGSILVLSIEADLDEDDLDDESTLQKTKEMVDSQLDLAQVASTQPDSFIAIKLTAFYPPKILKNWSHSLNALNLAEEVLVCKYLEHGIPLYQFLKPTCQKK
jgi:hypothetical protein